MKKLLLISLLFLFAGAAFGQSAPPCNNFDNVGVPVLYASPYPAVPVSPYNYNCTDYFGVANWANSPLPSSPITGYTLIAGGTGYASPQVVIVDKTGGSGATATATATAGVITAVTLGAAGTGYMLPQVTIVDVGVGGTLGAPTCGGALQPACGSGAMATPVLGGPYSGGMLKFQDPLVDLKTVIATKEITPTFPGSDYYEIAVVQYTQKMHASLPPTTLRGYVQVPTGSTGCTAALAAAALAPGTPGRPSYLGPVILATKNYPVRLKFTNCLPTGAGGNLFLPTDTTYMGAGMGPDPGQIYTQNRATLHLHGGANPWISDGTPHQWTVPVGDAAFYQKGMSTQSVPDMWYGPNGGAVIPACAGQTACAVPNATTDPGQGAMTWYWTNEQGGRLMFYHDHAYGLTRLNVYAGEAAGYLLVDPVEENILAAATVPGTVGATPDLAHLIPLVIQDKTFVPSAAQISQQDPTWAANFGTTPGTLAGQGANLGDLWMNHVYMPNQNPQDAIGGANGFGHWDYGAWFFPPMLTMTAATPPTAVTVPCTSSAFPGQLIAATVACPACGCPITPNPSGTPESFMDTPVVNGVAYPVLHVAPEAYRFRVLSAGNDRSLNLSWFIADPLQPGNTEVAMLPAAPPPANGPTLPLCGAINPVAVQSLKIGLVTALLDATFNPMNGTGLPANCWPNYGPSPGIPIPQTMWAADGRLGGAPDPRNAGPPWIQIGSEGGLLPAPVVIPATPTNYEQNMRSITVTSVAMHGLWLGPAERADAIVDFSKFAGKTLILYNDAPTPAPANDSRVDYFTGDGDQTPIGGAPNTPPGYGPNTRTLMQVIVDQPATVPAPPAFSLPALNAAFASTATTQGLFATTQPTTIVPEPFYNTAYNGTFPTTQMGIGANTLTYTPMPPCVPAPCVPITTVLKQEAIQELFTLDFGRMNSTMGTELPLTNFLVQTTLPWNYEEWPTEITKGGETQLWKVTHNGVDSHFIHFHLFNVQVVNRVGWDGSFRPIDANEAGWKDTVRMNPLEDILVALQPITPSVPFPLPDSIRPMDVTKPVGASDADTLPTPPGGEMSGIDPNTGNQIIPVGAGTTNALVNFGWEYVWHCHILGHEEMNMMRPIIHQVAPWAPTALLAANPDPFNPGNVVVTWGDNSASETSFTLQRDTLPNFVPTDPGFTETKVTGATPFVAGFSTLAFGTTVTLPDTLPGVGAYYYRVRADDSFQPGGPLPAPGFAAFTQAAPMSSGWSNIASVNAVPLTPTVTFTGAPASAPYTTSFVVTATTNSSSVPTITGTVGVCTVSAVSGTAASATALVTMTSGAGVCTLTANWAVDAFFLAATRTQITNAALAPLTITASSGTMIYRGTVPAITPSFATFVGGDTALTAFTTPPVCSTTATNTSAIGSYPSTCSGAVAANYAITYVAGTVTVTAVPLTVTAKSTSKAYGSTVTFLGTEFTVTGLLTGDTLTSVTLTSAGAAATATVALSPYPIVPSVAVGTGLSNYTITYVNGTLTVNPVALNITANSTVKAYGQTLTFTGTEFLAIGLLNGNTVTSVTLTSTGAAATAVPGSYPIVPSAAVGTGLTNYTILYVPGTLTVSKASTITTLTSALNPSLRGQIVTFNFSVAPQFTGVPSGSVTVTASTAETCTATLAAGAGSCTLTFLTGGSRTVTAVYSGDTNFLTSTSAAVNQRVSSVDLSTTSLVFGNQMQFTTSASQAVTLTNVGTASLSLTSIGVTGNFLQNNNCGFPGTLGVGRSCRINVTFTPATLGVLAGTLTITDVDPASPQTVALTGTGVIPAVVFTPSSLNFGTIARGTPATLPITLTNPGAAALTINRISFGGASSRQFAQTNNCGGTLAAGASCTINVTFSSSRNGRPATYNATLNVSDNAPGSPQTAALTATTF